MSLLTGVAYNFRGLGLGLRTPRLLALGLARFAITLAIAVVAAALVLSRHDQILALMWLRPESPWIAWLWHLLSWALALLLLAVSVLLGFLVAQVLFSALIMEYMSQATERMVTGGVRAAAPSLPWHAHFLRLLKQETLRAFLPVLVSMSLLLVAWLTPLGPVVTIMSALASAVFLAWDSTDLVPARRMMSFGQRWALLRRHLGFHLGFGLWFLVPLVNILFLSFAPVGATLFYVERIDPGARRSESR